MLDTDDVPPPPRFAERVLDAFGAGTRLREVVLGDLAEEFEERARWEGVAAARRWYLWEGARAVPWLLRDGLRALRGVDLAWLFFAVALASVALVTTESVAQLAVRLIAGAGWSSRLGGWPPATTMGAMLVWTFADGVCGGYVAASVGRRAPMVSGLALAAVWMACLPLVASPAPPGFAVANVLTAGVAMLVGAALRVGGFGTRDVGRAKPSGGVRGRLTH